MSDTTIRALKPRDRAYKVSDFDGMFLIVKPTGSRLWQFKYRIDGREKLLSIGVYPEVSLAQARATRDAARALLAKGGDPGQAKQERKLQESERRGHTFERYARAFMEKAAKEGRARVTQEKNQWLLNMAVAAFGSRPMTEITPQVVLACLR
ncbi:MAG: Arm DNA-binding domain-containing protein, partial [Paracoccaceae bacterium]